jgi:hypothetical protein
MTKTTGSPDVSGVGSTDLLACDCEKHAEPGFLTSGLRQEGEVWECPNCTKEWVQVHDEAEGDAWYQANKPPVEMLPLSEEKRQAVRDAVRSLQANRKGKRRALARPT